MLNVASDPRDAILDVGQDGIRRAGCQPALDGFFAPQTTETTNEIALSPR